MQNYLLSAYHMLGTIPGTKNKAVNKVDKVPLTTLWGRGDIQTINVNI